MLFVIAVAAGVLIGVSLGALGGGGAILAVPVLVYLLAQPPAAATTGALVVVGVSALLATLSHHRAGNVRWAEGLTFGLLGVLGTWLGSWLSRALRPNLLLAGFAVLLLVVAVLMFRRAIRGRKDTGVEAPPPITFKPLRVDVRRSLLVVATATGVGLLTGFFGVGGGFIIVPALVMAMGFRMPQAVGTSLVVIAVNSASALLARLGVGVRVDWAIVGALTAAAVAGSFLGGVVARKVESRKLTFAFAVLLVLAAAYIGVRSGLALAA